MSCETVTRGGYRLAHRFQLERACHVEVGRNYAALLVHITASQIHTVLYSNLILLHMHYHIDGM